MSEQKINPSQSRDHQPGREMVMHLSPDKERSDEPKAISMRQLRVWDVGQVVAMSITQALNTQVVVISGASN